MDHPLIPVPDTHSSTSPQAFQPMASSLFSYNLLMGWVNKGRSILWLTVKMDLRWSSYSLLEVYLKLWFEYRRKYQSEKPQKRKKMAKEAGGIHYRTGTVMSC